MIAGIDEVGRGPWAGPLVAGAVILGEPIIGLKDSKKLTKAQRQLLSVEIRAKVKAFGLGWVWPSQVDKLGLSKAVELAMRQALSQIKCGYDEVIIDGNINYLADIKASRALIKADDSVEAVSAASILAKVARDDYMVQIAKKYPGYGFENHVGYGTAAHLAALQHLGVSDIHRRSYKPIRRLLND